ncbi:1-acyl-sn-glycerol-3-phosphate acyltransferase 1, chloroplastic [Morus notabilis]|uniref:1-acyl-sn-glycerol-3-phosphate acyltransferase 1, chloroplastic n=1 Tax=Morus notabilis TaxID=981085 RepID=UPI000CED5B25|nr:1-acyl-sn-glycerol-3-phosphate acyltransferase 1, chloroplastic [Morus notabilis]
MESGSSLYYGTVSLSWCQGIILPPKTVPLRISFNSKSQLLKLDLCHGLCSPPSFQLFAYKGRYIGCFQHKRESLGCSSCSARNSFICSPRAHGIIPWSLSNKQEKLNVPHYNVKMQNRGKASRDIVVRSELTGTGIPDTTFPLPEQNMVSKARGICFYAVTAVVAIFLFVLMVLQHPFVLLLDRYRRKAHFFIAKLWATLTVSPFLNIKFEGLENLPPVQTPAVYVSNHQSFLDIYTLLTLGRPFKFISKTSVFLFPIIGWAMFLLGVIPLKRMDSRSQLDCLKRCMDLIKKGASVFFFPEGTRSKDGTLGAFKKGAFSVAAKAKVPVVPITLIGTGKLMPSGMEGILNSGDVKVIIHKPIEGSDPQVLCDESRNVIVNGLTRHA